MERTDGPAVPSSMRPNNRLLRALPEDVFARIQPELTTIPTTAKQLFHRHAEPLTHVFFLNGGVASVTTVLTDGTMVETATIGNEGVIGLEALFSDQPIAAGETILQVPDTSAEQMTVAAFRRELARHGRFADLMGRYAQATLAQIMQSTACNARHPVPERCCRWLLMTHDRVEGDSFRLSQEFLAVMLGVRRQSVSAVSATLQSDGLIAYKHGVITILDRAGLERAACECYAIVRRQLDRCRLP
jgi:CRP-like cAMP-binding protein